MGKAVGGASAAGCGIFGIGGLLIGVGLTVWLGSMALSGSTGGGRDRAPSASADTSTSASTAAPTLPPGAAIVLDQPEGRTDGGLVTVTGSGFAPGPLVLTTCLTHAPGPLAERCDATADAAITAAADGTWIVSYTVRRQLIIDGTSYDCAASPGACSIVAHLAQGDDATGAPFAFTDDLAPIDATAPPTG